MVTTQPDEVEIRSDEATADLFGGGAVVVELAPGLVAQEVERRLGVALRAGEACNRALAFYMAEVAARRLFTELGFPDAARFARQRFGMGKSRAYELIAVGRQLLELPRLDEAFARGELGWSRVRLVARVATPQTEPAWIERARSVASEELEAMVAAADRGDLPPKGGEGLPSARFVLRVTLDALGQRMLERAREKLAAETGRALSDRDLLTEALALVLSSDADGSVPGRRRIDGSMFRVAVRGASDGAAQGPEPDAVVLPPERLLAIDSDASVPASLRRRILERDGCSCQACGSRRALMIHHVVWRSRGGRTIPSNLCPLCMICHGMVHDGYLFVSGVPGSRVFTDRRGRPTTGPVADAPVDPGATRILIRTLQVRAAAADSTAAERRPPHDPHRPAEPADT